MTETEVAPSQMCDIIEDAAIEMGRAEDSTGLLGPTAVLLMRVVSGWQHDRHDTFPPIVLRAAFQTAVAWLEATALTEPMDARS